MKQGGKPLTFLRSSLVLGFGSRFGDVLVCGSGIGILACGDDVAVLALGSGIGILACGEDLDVLAIVNMRSLHGEEGRGNFSLSRFMSRFLFELFFSLGHEGLVLSCT